MFFVTLDFEKIEASACSQSLRTKERYSTKTCLVLSNVIFFLNLVRALGTLLFSESSCVYILFNLAKMDELFLLTKEKQED